MKHIKPINELFGLRKLFNKDEDIVNGIIDKIDSNTIQEEISIPCSCCNEGDGDEMIKMEIDGYEINIGLFYTKSPDGVHYSNKKDSDIIFGRKYKVWIDGVEMRCSNYVSEKLWNKCKNIKSRSHIDYTRKDAKIHFKKR